MSTATATRMVDFLGLSEFAEVRHDEASFPLGTLYPYSRDLQDVCARYDAVRQEFPDTASALIGESRQRPTAPLRSEQATPVAAFLASIAMLHSRIAFAPGPAGESVASAYRRASNAVTPKRRRRPW